MKTEFDPDSKSPDYLLVIVVNEKIQLHKNLT